MKVEQKIHTPVNLLSLILPSLPTVVNLLSLPYYRPYTPPSTFSVQLTTVLIYPRQSSQSTKLPSLQNPPLHTPVL